MDEHIQGQVYRYRCHNCEEGEITFMDWCMLEHDDDPSPHGDGYLGLRLGCSTCVATYLVLPDKGKFFEMVQEGGAT